MGIILMYDITNLVTFNHITKWIESIENMAPPDTCTVLVGNKCDKYLCRAVDEERGKKLAENFGLDFFEASCKSNINVDQVFQHIATKIKDIKDKRAKRFQRTASNVSLTHWSMESGSHETKVFKCSC
ncbi:unnamed protein product [Owenia fusiformis]|nr:unnamed protein product [Owenia fusiformis]